MNYHTLSLDEWPRKNITDPAFWEWYRQQVGSKTNHMVKQIEDGLPFGC